MKAWNAKEADAINRVLPTVVPLYLLSRSIAADEQSRGLALLDLLPKGHLFHIYCFLIKKRQFIVYAVWMDNSGPDLNLSRPLTGAHTFLQKMTDTYATMPQVIIEKTMLFMLY
jgi:hypothetical protein